MKKSFLFIISIAVWLMSCQPEESIPQQKTISFSFSEPGTNAVSSNSDDLEVTPVSILVTIENASGTVIADRPLLSLSAFGDEHLSDELSLQTSAGNEYRVTEFFVVNDRGEIIDAAPKEDSAKPHLVEDPLDIEFVIESNEVTLVTPEVVAVDNTSDPVAYGYGQFGFSVVQFINTVFTSAIAHGDDRELTTSHVTIEGLAVTGQDTTVAWSYQRSLEAADNNVLLKKGRAYRIRAKKQGYSDWVMVKTLSNLQRVEIVFGLPAENDFKIWNISYSAPTGGVDFVRNSIRTNDNGTLVISTVQYTSQQVVARIDRNGNRVWRKYITIMLKQEPIYSQPCMLTVDLIWQEQFYVTDSCRRLYSSRWNTGSTLYRVAHLY